MMNSNDCGGKRASVRGRGRLLEVRFPGQAQSGRLHLEQPFRFGHAGSA